MVTKIVKWYMDISPQNEKLYTSESILNTRSEEFNSFIKSITRMLETSGYVLNNYHGSNQVNSNSLYYEFLKFDEDVVRVKLIIFIRISDHKAPDRVVHNKNTHANQRRQGYQDDIRVPQIMKDFKTSERPMSVDVDIIFDDNHFICYEDALQYIHKVIGKLD